MGVAVVLCWMSAADTSWVGHRCLQGMLDEAVTSLNSEKQARWGHEAPKVPCSDPYT
jgi:hypothetical protein